MKTPIQELLTAIRLKKYVETNEQAWEAYDYVVGIAKSLLEKEMAVIIEAFHEGMRCQGWDPNRGIAEEYYNETFNTKD